MNIFDKKQQLKLSMYNYKYYTFLVCNKGNTHISLKERQKHYINSWYLKHIEKYESRNKNCREIVLKHHHSTIIMCTENYAVMIYRWDQFECACHLSFGYRQEFLDLFYKK